MDLPVIEKEALMLPDTDRALLADRLLASLPTESSELKGLWVAEAQSRLAAYERGELTAVDGPQAVAALRAKFSK